jgi:hypothetical protein
MGRAGGGHDDDRSSVGKASSKHQRIDKKEEHVNYGSPMKYLARDHMSLVEQIDELVVTAALSSSALLVLSCVPSVDVVLRLIFGRFLLLFSDHHRQ